VEPRLRRLQDAQDGFRRGRRVERGLDQHFVAGDEAAHPLAVGRAFGRQHVDLGREAGRDLGRLDQRNLDPVGLHLVAQREHEPLHGELAGGVDRLERKRDLSDQRRNGHELPGAALAHAGDEGLQDRGGADHVDLEAAARLLEVDFLEGTEESDADVREHHVGAAPAAQHLVAEREDAGPIADVERRQEALAPSRVELGPQRFDARGVDVEAGDHVAARRQTQRDLPPHSLRQPGDDHDLHGCTFLRCFRARQVRTVCRWRAPRSRIESAKSG
jgi:hypothetical protein